MQAVQLAFGSERVDSLAVDDGAGTGAVVVAEAILEIRWVGESPVPLPGPWVQALDDLFPALPMQVKPNSRRGSRASYTRYPWLAPIQAAALEDHSPSGFSFRERPARRSPLGSLASSP